jgi:hypothetical protein
MNATYLDVCGRLETTDCMLDLALDGASCITVQHLVFGVVLDKLLGMAVKAE